MVSPICKAKDPRLCPYHGTVIRMNEAQAAGNFDDYYTERKKLEELKATNWEDLDDNQAFLKGSLGKPLDATTLPYPVGLGTPAEAQARTAKAAAANAQANKDDDNAYALRPDQHPALPNRFDTQLAQLRAPLDAAETATDGVFSSDHSKAQAGEILNTIDVKQDGYIRRFYRRGSGVTADPQVPGGDFYEIRLQANRKLSPDEAQKLAGITGYQYRSTIAGESIGDPYQDTPYSIVVGADSTKSARDDLGDGLFDFEATLNEMVKNGTPIRKTNRAGVGTQGTRLIDGFGEDLKIEIYYDSKG